ncbi:hypothetical protein PTSG_10647 [Salpingoeca rosetta]|uniref:Uncharacterized protein n=1 Tax=Salpingoeca rosetta (strain ATCC 50818 / BSB-021) TaxID=946362 RepID=F2URY7_SALR5|nr:uncharacterized protein PTSG_10647 [Salpingoeca rosetta]EGD80392.1 hypothetical protein PTSG_10647 [Salpingoeca rosetta]|eukprot:XP_004988182.1 hypothetical protein PTSG_10647 [Salpingoeca rosetta]
MGKAMGAICCEMKERHSPFHVGDVKYHLGLLRSVQRSNKQKLLAQADAERFRGLRTTVLADARAEHVFIQAQAPLASLTVSNADNVHINACSAVIDNLVIRDVTRVVWLPATTQRSTACHLSNVQHIDLRTKSTLTEDLGAFAGIPSVGLCNCQR